MALSRHLSRALRHAAVVAAASCAVVSIAACSSSDDGSSAGKAPAVFVTQPDFQTGTTPPCLVHQNEQPNSAYRGGQSSQSVPELTFLSYYTAGGNLAFCDGQPATETDKVWAQLYSQLTGSPQNVKKLLGSP